MSKYKKKKWGFHTRNPKKEGHYEVKEVDQGLFDCQVCHSGSRKTNRRRSQASQKHEENTPASRKFTS